MPFDGTTIRVDLLPYADDLAKAKQQIITHGWCQGLNEATDGRVCLIGAIRKGLGLSAFAVDPRQQLEDRVDIVAIALNKYTGSALTSWNDTPGRTKEEVLELLTV